MARDGLAFTESVPGEDAALIKTGRLQLVSATLLCH
jgi:hypothetical protein